MKRNDDYPNSAWIIARKVKMDVEEVVEYLDSDHVGFNRFLTVLDVHRLRTEGGMTCKDCEFRNLCMKKPLARMILLNYMEKDISSIEGMNGFYYV